jgi:sugar lactone lactonase YvrE
MAQGDVRARAGKWIGFCLASALAVAAAGSLTVLSSQGSQDAQAAARKDFDSTLSRADALVAAGDYFEAVLQYERAARVAYNNKLTIDKAALDVKLAAARRSRDAAKNAPAPRPANPGPGDPDRAAEGMPFVELTTPLATGQRVLTSRTVPPGGTFGPSDEGSRWVVTNPYLPADRKFFERINLMACAPDGSVYLAGGSLVSAAETHRQPIANKSFYAPNGTGIWRVAPTGAITAFGVHASVNQPGADHVTARCNVDVASAGIKPDDWGGLAVDAAGNAWVSDSDLNLILKFTRDGRVEHVAGGGPQACGYDRWKTLQKSGYLDGPAQQALFDHPAGLGFDRDGNLLVADTGNCALRRIDRNGQVTTVRKECAPDERPRGAPRTTAYYEFLAIDPDGLPLVGGALFNGVEQFGDVYRIQADGQAERVLVGRRYRPQSKQQELGRLGGITVRPDGTVLVTDELPQNSKVYEVRDGRLVLVAGLGDAETTLEHDVDGPATQARLWAPHGLCSAPDGTVFVQPGKGGHPLHRIDARTRTVSTWVY